MAVGKHIPEGVNHLEPPCRHTAIDIEMKLRMICKYECGQSLSAVALEYIYAVSTMNTTLMDAARMKEYAKVYSVMKSMIITKTLEGAVSGMGNYT
jgi:hypothetical protein